MGLYRYKNMYRNNELEFAPSATIVKYTKALESFDRKVT